MIAYLTSIMKWRLADSKDTHQDRYEYCVHKFSGLSLHAEHFYWY
jgi:hypothetical protein